MVITPTITCPRIRLFKHALRLEGFFDDRDRSVAYARAPPDRKSGSAPANTAVFDKRCLLLEQCPRGERARDGSALWRENSGNEANSGIPNSWHDHAKDR